MPTRKKTETTVGKVVTKTEFAKIVGKSTATIGNWQDEGMPSVRTGSGRGGNKINTAAALAWVITREVQRRAPTTGQGPTSIDRERLRLLSEQADAAAIKNAQDRGELIAAEFVQEITMTAVANLAGALAGLPGRLATEVARESDPAACRELIRNEIDRARNQFADDFEFLSESFADRADSGDDNAPAAGAERGDLGGSK